MHVIQRPWLAAVHLPTELFYSLRVLCHRIYALIPNSWFRSFCRTRVQKAWDSNAELDDTLFAPKHSRTPDTSKLCLWAQPDAHGFGSGLRIDYKPPRECQCGSYRHVLSGVWVFNVRITMFKNHVAYIHAYTHMHAYVHARIHEYIHIYARIHNRHTYT